MMGWFDRPIGDDGLPEGYPFKPEYEVTPRETAGALRDGRDGFVLIDVREAGELAVASVEGAVHIPLGDLQTRINEIDADEDTELAVICHTGVRSLKAAIYLQQIGLSGARSVAGGSDRWSRDVDPSVPRY